MVISPSFFFQIYNEARKETALCKLGLRIKHNPKFFCIYEPIKYLCRDFKTYLKYGCGPDFMLKPRVKFSPHDFASLQGNNPVL